MFIHHIKLGMIYAIDGAEILNWNFLSKITWDNEI